MTNGNLNGQSPERSDSPNSTSTATSVGTLTDITPPSGESQLSAHTSSSLYTIGLCDHN